MMAPFLFDGTPSLVDIQPASEFLYYAFGGGGEG